MAQDNLLGQTLNGYEILDVVGRGGMATVYSARQISMNRVVAMKVLPRQFVDDDTYIQRFTREVSIVSQLEHRSIIPVYDYGEYERQPYIIMRYMPAGSIDSLLSAGAIPLERVLEIIRQIAPALDYAISKNVLHRDLKPSNVLLDNDGGAYLTDFGIARIVGEAGNPTITTQGVVGTPSYMSPEQAQGKPLDGRSDLYSLGVMLFEMTTGRRPFESDTPYGVAVMQVTTPPPQPRSINPHVPPSIEQVIYRAMSKNPEQRYQTAAELFSALEHAYETRDLAPKADTHPRRVFLPPQQPVMPSPPPQVIYPPPNITPAPQMQAQRAHESQWGTAAASVPVRRVRRRRAEGNVWVSLMLGATIGCAMLIALVAVVAYLLSNINEILPTVEEEPPAAFSVPSDTPPTLTPNLAENLIIPTLDATSASARETLLPPSTPTPFVPTAVPVIIEDPKPTSLPLTPTIAPIGVRP